MIASRALRSSATSVTDTRGTVTGLTPTSGTIQLKWDDTTVAPLTTYSYRVIARGVGGNRHSLDGPTDPEVGILAVRVSGKLAAVALIYGMHPTVMHDLHESVTYLYASTGSGPYNEQLDPITVNEWWNLAINEVQEMTKRGVPGVWTYGFYDGWTPNYLFWIANTHNSIGRFYETQTYGPQNQTISSNASKEWYRPNPPLPSIKWGPRNNVNIQQSALIITLAR